ncbi:hypothetical protein NDI56_12215 [Haloarcula sp. S1CR25-12]|uniref:Uncharacterized protein n=1 Tax=Haloarcula saliterrae TaxID=2950534 RepID=A0ABU2FD16_9EURY|nr:hypothetical protein [Haloarcula sp. S1CR25-12]MDS0260160.1 hypothetical protein [Haloarcula sp. S1CR25-12]
MTQRQSRRALLTGLGGAGVGAMAGCLRLGDPESGTGTATSQSTGTETGTQTESDGETDEQPESSGETGTGGQTDTPAWAQWIPSDPVVSGTAETFALDVQGARAEFPQAEYERYEIQDIADTFGIEQSDIDYLGGMERSDDSGLVFLTGTFDQDEIRSNLGVSESDTESYQGSTVYDGLAWGPDAIVTSNYQTVLDTRFGGTQSIDAAGTGWETLLSVVSSGTLSGVQSGSFVDSLSVSVPRSGIAINAASGGGATITAHLMFDSESRAAEVFENNEDEIRADAPDADQTLESLEQQGKRIVFTVSSDTFEF